MNTPAAIEELTSAASIEAVLQTGLLTTPSSDPSRVAFVKQFRARLASDPVLLARAEAILAAYADQATGVAADTDGVPATYGWASTTPSALIAQAAAAAAGAAAGNAN